MGFSRKGRKAAIEEIMENWTCEKMMVKSFFTVYSKVKEEFMGKEKTVEDWEGSMRINEKKEVMCRKWGLDTEKEYKKE